MGVHDKYGKELLRRVMGGRFYNWAASRNVKVGQVNVSLDGVITNKGSAKVVCAVEIEAENETQIRGAILKLSLHPAPKALLVPMPRNLANPLPVVLDHIQQLWTRLTGGARGELTVVTLVGDGRECAWELDEERLKTQLARLDVPV